MSKNLFWYQGICKSATVEFHDVTGKAKPKKPVHISDPAVLQKITELLGKLPTSGEIMVSMGPTAITKLTLDCDKSKYEIQFFGGRIKTPNTSFFAGGRPEETELFSLLNKVD